MSEREALLNAVLADPGDDTPRLVMADWLDEHGEAERGAFIRMQCELAEGPRVYREGWANQPKIDADAARMRALRNRERALLRSPPALDGIGDTHGNAWEWMGAARLIVPNGAAYPDHVVFRRGFVDEIRLPLAAFLAHAADLFAAHPIQKVTPTDAVVHQSGGNDTYYVGGLGMFPAEYWRRLEGHPSRRSALGALSTVCVDFGRAAASLARQVTPPAGSPCPAGS